MAPSGGGAHSWAQMAFNPATGLVYMPIVPDSTFNFTSDPNFKFTPGAMNLGLDLGALFGGPPAPGAPARPPNAVPKTIGPTRPRRTSRHAVGLGPGNADRKMDGAGRRSRAVAACFPLQVISCFR